MTTPAKPGFLSKVKDRFNEMLSRISTKKAANTGKPATGPRPVNTKPTKRTAA